MRSHPRTTRLDFEVAMALERLDLREDKINCGKAQIICTACEQIKTIQGSPFEQGTTRHRIV